MSALAHTHADLGHDGEENEGGDGVRDEGCNNEDNGAEDDQNGVDPHAFNVLADILGDDVEEAGGGDGFSERETTACEHDDGPKEVVEVFLGEDARAKECREGDNSNDAHIAQREGKLMGDAPEDDSRQRNEGDKVLGAGELILGRPDGDNCSSAVGTVDEKEQDPDEEDRHDGDGEGDEEPFTPGGRRSHVLECNDVLGGGDRRRHAADVGSEGDANDEGLGELGLRGEVAKHGLHELA